LIPKYKIHIKMGSDNNNNNIWFYFVSHKYLNWFKCGHSMSKTIAVETAETELKNIIELYYSNVG